MGICTVCGWDIKSLIQPKRSEVPICPHCRSQQEIICWYCNEPIRNTREMVTMTWYWSETDEEKRHFCNHYCRESAILEGLE